MPYKVLIVVKNEWWSDQLELPTFAAARKHQTLVAAKWNDCETAIKAPDGRVLSFRESNQFEAEMKAVRKCS